jgi:hypothetical protein
MSGVRRGPGGTKKPAGIPPDEWPYSDAKRRAQQLILRTPLDHEKMYILQGPVKPQIQARFKRLFHVAEGAYPDVAVGCSAGLRSQGGVKLPTGGNAFLGRTSPRALFGFG